MAALDPGAVTHDAAGRALRGQLVERIDAAPYSYLKLATATGEVWAAVPQTTVAPLARQP